MCKDQTYVCTKQDSCLRLVQYPTVRDHRQVKGGRENNVCLYI